MLKRKLRIMYVTTNSEHVLLQTAEGYVTDQKESEEQLIKNIAK